MNHNKHFKFFVAGLVVVGFLPFYLAGFIWNEVKIAFQDGITFSKNVDDAFGRWLNGNS